jgi:hypothetical protein
LEIRKLIREMSIANPLWGATSKSSQHSVHDWPRSLNDERKLGAAAAVLKEFIAVLRIGVSTWKTDVRGARTASCDYGSEIDGSVDGPAH